MVAARHTHTHTHTHARTHARMHAHAHTHTHTNTLMTEVSWLADVAGYCRSVHSLLQYMYLLRQNLVPPLAAGLERGCFVPVRVSLW